MTKEEFTNQKWGAKMQCGYRGEVYRIISVNFEEMLVGLIPHDEFQDKDSEITWARCENIQLLTWNTKE